MQDALLLGTARAAVLREMFLNPDRRVSLNDVVRGGQMLGCVVCHWGSSGQIPRARK